MKIQLLSLVSSLAVQLAMAVPAPMETTTAIATATRTHFVERTVNTITPIYADGYAYVPEDCSNPGELVCISDLLYGICDHGKRVTMRLAVGDHRCVGKAGQVFT